MIAVTRARSTRQPARAFRDAHSGGAARSAVGLAGLASLAVWASVALLSLSGCAAAPTEAESERLDSNTGTTVTLMPRPIELVVERARGPKTDPFAYLAPFETNRMGAHEMFLWITAPQVAGALGTPQLYCGEQLMELEPMTSDLQSIGLSNAPYKLPAPWSVQWYFKLSGEVLDCLASAARIRVVTESGEEEPDRYIADTAALSGLGEFVARVKM